MGSHKTITFYLDPALRTQAREGKFNFVNRIAQAVEPLGYSLAFTGGGRAPRMASIMEKGYAIFHMEDPFHDRALTMRRVYHAPFWAIENSAKRWEWHVARQRFEGPAADPGGFVQRWRKRLFDGWGDGAVGHVYVPLQGRILEQRSFQSCVPIEMLRQVCEAVDRPVVATLHPNEKYGAAEKDALQALSRAHPRLMVETGQMDQWLPGAHAVITMNSSAAFNGFFFRRPAILFGKIDFHHIALDAAAVGLDAALNQLDQHQPDYEGYIHWFWQEMSINAGHPTAEAKILAALRRGGWAL